MHFQVRAIVLLVLLELFQVCAHDVVWPGNPEGLKPAEPLAVDFGTEALIQVQPVTGEPCIVAVNLDMLASTLVKAEIISDNPAKTVVIRVTPLRASNSPFEVATIRGEWHATGAPDPNECTALLPNRFSVTVRVVGGPSGPSIDQIHSQAGAPGSTLRIIGSGFSAAMQVSFAGVNAQFTISDDFTIQAIVPSDAPVGKIAVTTPNGRVESAVVFLVLPKLDISPTTGQVVNVRWPDRKYPVTLQQTLSLNEPNWIDLTRTIENSVQIPIENGLQFYRLSWLEVPLDRTDYNRDRPLVAAFYQQDPVAYWAFFGIPALSRLAIMRQNLNLEPFAPFAGFLQAFDTNRFLNSLQRNELPPPFSITVSNQLAKGVAVTNAFLNSLVTLVSDSDATNCPQIIRTNCFLTNSFGPAFVSVMTNTMSTNGWSAWTPQTNKAVPQSQLTNYTPNWVDVHGSDGFAMNQRPSRPPNDNNDTTFHINWDAISASTTWNTTYDAACAAVAVGASLAKLGVISSNTTCQFWNDLSRLLGATPGQLGAYPSDIAAFYSTLGYGCTQAYDGPFESAVEEAKKALERGCDVQIDYYNPDRSRGHTEMVLGITIDPTSSKKATISTLSWGSHATVTYTGSSSGGSYSGKSDGQQYRKPNETVSYLEQTGISVIRYYCKE